MNAPQPRRPMDNDHPSWCTGDHYAGRCRSKRVSTGDFRYSGEVDVTVARSNTGVWATVTVRRGTAIAADVPLGEAEAWLLRALELVRQAGK